MWQSFRQISGRKRCRASGNYRIVVGGVHDLVLQSRCRRLPRVPPRRRPAPGQPHVCFSVCSFSSSPCAARTLDNRRQYPHNRDHQRMHDNHRTVGWQGRLQGRCAAPTSEIALGRKSLPGSVWRVEQHVEQHTGRGTPRMRQTTAHYIAGVPARRACVCAGRAINRIANV